MRTRSQLALVVVALVALCVDPTKLHSQTSSVNRLLLQLQQQDISGVPVLNRTIGFKSYNGTVGTFVTGTLTSTSPTTITLPTTTVLQLYIHHTGSSGTLSVTWTVSGFGSNLARVMKPDGQTIFWETDATGSNGITALSLQASVAPMTYELFLGG